MDKKQLWKKYQGIISPVLALTNHFRVRTYARGKNNRNVGLDRILAKGSRISIRGDGNEIVLGEMSQLINCSISVGGGHNRIVIGDRNFLMGVSITLLRTLGM